MAQIVAFQFWINNEKDRKSNWDNYQKLCKIGGSKSFLQILKDGNLMNPFEEETIKSVSSFLNDYISSVNDVELDK